MLLGNLIYPSVSLERLIRDDPRIENYYLRYVADNLEKDESNVQLHIADRIMGEHPKAVSMMNIPGRKVQLTLLTGVAVVGMFWYGIIAILKPVSCSDEVFRYATPEGKVTILPEFEFGLFSEGLVPVGVRNEWGFMRWGFMDKAGKIVIPLQFYYARGFQEGLAPVLVANQWGFIDKAGKLVSPPQFDDLPFSFEEGLAPVRVGDKWGFIDKAGKLVSPPQFDEV